jgi:hypothetical protein
MSPEAAAEFAAQLEMAAGGASSTALITTVFTVLLGVGFQ